MPTRCLERYVGMFTWRSETQLPHMVGWTLGFSF